MPLKLLPDNSNSAHCPHLHSTPSQGREGVCHGFCPSHPHSGEHDAREIRHQARGGRKPAQTAHGRRRDLRSFHVRWHLAIDVVHNKHRVTVLTYFKREDQQRSHNFRLSSHTPPPPTDQVLRRSAGAGGQVPVARG